VRLFLCVFGDLSDFVWGFFESLSRLEELWEVGGLNILDWFKVNVLENITY
jgi:hypothetical protein